MYCTRQNRKECPYFLSRYLYLTQCAAAWWSGDGKRDNPIFPFLLALLSPLSRLSPHKAKTRIPSPLPFSALLGSTCLHNRDRMQIPIPTELQTVGARSHGRSWVGGRGYSFQKLRTPPLLRLQTLSLRHPSLETCSGAAAADIVAYIVLTALSFRDREKERESGANFTRKLDKSDQVYKLLLLDKRLDTLKESSFNFDLAGNPVRKGSLVRCRSVLRLRAPRMCVRGCDADDKSFWEFTARVVILPLPSLSSLPSFFLSF